MKELICIVCPKGCHLTVDEEKDWAVTGNGCPRGEEYGRSEYLCPVRTLGTTVRVTGAAEPLLPVRTDRPIPKEKLFACMELIRRMTIPAPVTTGQVLVENIADTGANLISCAER